MLLGYDSRVGVSALGAHELLPHVPAYASSAGRSVLGVGLCHDCLAERIPKARHDRCWNDNACSAALRRGHVAGSLFVSPLLPLLRVEDLRLRKEEAFALAVAFFPLATYVLLFFYFVDYHRPSHYPAPPGPWVALQGGLAVLSNAFGVFPATCIYLGLLLSVASLVVSTGLVLKAFRDPCHRDRCIILLVAGVSIVGLAFSIGYSRITFSYPKIYLGPRLTTLVCPIFFVLWAGFLLAWRPNAKPILQTLLACVVLLTLGANYQDGYRLMRVAQERNTRILINAHVMNKRGGKYFVSKYSEAFRGLAEYAIPAIDELCQKKKGIFSPEARQKFLKSFLPYWEKKVRLDALRCCIDWNLVPEEKQMRFSRDGATGWSLVAEPYTSAVVELPRQASSIEVEFGVYRFPYRHRNKPDLEFRISIEHSTGEVEKIWSRCLEQVTFVSDRGIQHASIVLPPVERRAKLIVGTLWGKRPSLDSGYWSDFQVLDKSGSILDIPHASSRSAKDLSAESPRIVLTDVVDQLRTGEYPMYGIKTSDESQDGLAIIATSRDPIIMLPTFQTSGRRRRVMKIDLTSPCPTTLEVFYATRMEPRFCRENSIQESINEGRNVLSLKLPKAELTGRLRVDPGGHAGKYVIHDIEVREVPDGAD